jgi:DNA-binding CsgD family transcriptional regulator
VDDVELAILRAWRDLAPKLARDPVELQRRLDRARRSRTLVRPPRAWCLAIRASDTRVDALLRPDGAPPLRWAHKNEHNITLDASTIRRLCAPVSLDAPGLTIDEVAARLGTTRTGLLHARVAGRFQTHHVRGLGAHWGRPRPLLYTSELLDPSARGFVTPDPLWSWTARSLTQRIGDDLPAQTLRRVPRFQPRGPTDRDTTGLHPEHPNVDTFALSELRESKGQSKSLKLPPPPPDYVWYKWKGDEYLGHDWRKPAARAGHARFARRTELARAAARKRRRENPPLRAASGSLEFRGWQWRCPRCGKAVNVLYMPVPGRELLVASCELLVADGAPALRAQPATSNQQPATSSFACDSCHRVKRFSRCDPNAWNEIVTYLSAGLLFGHEVERPAWFPRAPRAHSGTRAAGTPTPTPANAHTPPGRKIPYKPRPNRAPSQRRAQIEQAILTGHTFAQIAARLGLAKGTVLWHAQQLYQQHGVRTLPQLLARLGHAELIKDSRYKTAEIRARLRAGQSTRQIADALSVPMHSVYNQRVRLLKEGVRPHDGRAHHRLPH